MKLLADRGLIAGFKVRGGLKPLSLAEDGIIIEGLDGLQEWLTGQQELRAGFSKWVSVILIGPDLSSA